MTDSLEGRTCLVTGASRGIGAEIAMRLAERGARIVVHYGRNRGTAEGVVSALPGHGHFAVGADLSLPQNAAACIDEVMRSVDVLDVLVNNAGIFKSHPPLQTDDREWLDCWQETLAVNLVSPAVLCRAAACHMAAQGGGRIINIGSRGAFRGEPDAPAYGASKAALHALSQSLAVALAASNIQVFAVAPGFVETDMARSLLDGPGGDGIRSQSPAHRVARPAEVAELVCFLAATEAEFMTGGIIDVNGASYLRT